MHGWLLVVFDFEFVTHHRIVTYEEYWCEISEYKRPTGEQLLLCHIRFDHFTPASMKRLLREWKIFRSVVKCPLYAFAAEDNSEKWVRFVSHLGFQSLGTEVVCNNGERRSLFISVIGPSDVSHVKRNYQPEQ